MNKVINGCYFSADQRESRTAVLRKRKVENDYKATRKKSRMQHKQKLTVEMNKKYGENTLKKSKMLDDKSCDNEAKTSSNVAKVEGKNNQTKTMKKKINKETTNSKFASKTGENSSFHNDLLKEEELVENKPQISNKDLELPMAHITDNQESNLGMSADKSSQVVNDITTEAESEAELKTEEEKDNICKEIKRQDEVIPDQQSANENDESKVNGDIQPNLKENTQNTNSDRQLRANVQIVGVKAKVKQMKPVKGNNALDVIKEVVREKVKQTAYKCKKNCSFKKEIKTNQSEKDSKSSVCDIEKYTKIGDYYVCSYCSRKFQWLGPFKKHVTRHTRNEFDCKECGKKFTNYRSLMAHKYSRKKERSFNCELCNFSTSTACLLRKHSKEEHPPEIFFHCHICPKILKTKSYLNVHLKYYHNINEGKYECHICGKLSKRPKLFEKHMKLHEQDPPDSQLTCTVCGKTFQSKLHLRSHSRIHKDRKFLCDFCGKGFCTKTKLNEHKRTHTGEKPYSCNKCDYSSTQRGNLRLHMKVHDKEKTLPEKQPYKCKHCNYTVNRVSYFLQHMKSHEKVHDKIVTGKQKDIDVNKKTLYAEQVESVNTKSEKQKESNILDNSDYFYSSETALFNPTDTQRVVSDTPIHSPQNSQKRLKKNRSVDLEKDTSATEETHYSSSSSRTVIPSDVNSDPSLWTPEYFRTYMTDQYNAARSGYQETAPHLMYLNQQKYYEANSGIYDNSKQTQTATELYSDPKYSTDATQLKNTGAASKPYGSPTKSEIGMQNLFLPSSGQILRQMLAASQDLYSDSNVPNNYNTRQYQETDTAYDMSYSGMYMQPEQGEMNETTTGRSTHKYQDYNLALKSDLSRSAPNYSAHHLDPYTVQGHDFNSPLPVISSDQVLQYTNRKDETSLYPPTAPTDVQLAGNVSPVYSHNEQEYMYENLEQSSTVSGKVTQ